MVESFPGQEEHKVIMRAIKGKPPKSKKNHATGKYKLGRLLQQTEAQVMLKQGGFLSVVNATVSLYKCV